MSEENVIDVEVTEIKEETVKEQASAPVAEEKKSAFGKVVTTVKEDPVKAAVILGGVVLTAFGLNKVRTNRKAKKAAQAQETVPGYGPDQLNNDYTEC